MSTRNVSGLNHNTLEHYKLDTSQVGIMQVFSVTVYWANDVEHSCCKAWHQTNGISIQIQLASHGWICSIVLLITKLQLSAMIFVLCNWKKACKLFSQMITLCSLHAHMNTQVWHLIIVVVWAKGGWPGNSSVVQALMLSVLGLEKCNLNVQVLWSMVPLAVHHYQNSMLQS